MIVENGDVIVVDSMAGIAADANCRVGDAEINPSTTTSEPRGQDPRESSSGEFPFLDCPGTELTSGI
jgi:hypothetical protein